MWTGRSVVAFECIVVKVAYSFTAFVSHVLNSVPEFSRCPEPSGRNLSQNLLYQDCKILWKTNQSGKCKICCFNNYVTISCHNFLNRFVIGTGYLTSNTMVTVFFFKWPFEILQKKIIKKIQCAQKAFSHGPNKNESHLKCTILNESMNEEGSTSCSHYYLLCVLWSSPFPFKNDKLMCFLKSILQ